MDATPARIAKRPHDPIGIGPGQRQPVPADRRLGGADVLRVWEEAHLHEILFPSETYINKRVCTISINGGFTSTDAAAAG